jgi:hypothetical protein
MDVLLIYISLMRLKSVPLPPLSVLLLSSLLLLLWLPLAPMLPPPDDDDGVLVVPLSEQMDVKLSDISLVCSNHSYNCSYFP